MGDGVSEDEEQQSSLDAGPDAGQPAEPRVTAPPRPFDDEADGAPDEPSAEGDLDAGAAAEGGEEAEAAPPPAPSEPDAPGPFEDLSELPSLLEALLFVADHPIDAGYLARAIEVSTTRVETALTALADSLRESNRGLRLQRGPAGVQLVSAPEAAAHVERFLGLEANRRLSTAALETLAIIAYRQPITRGQVDAVRGVSSDGAIATLRARELIEPAGHAPGPGRPMLFRTTQRFLEHFGLERPGQLPALPDDVDLPASEIGAQLGLDDATIAAALDPLDPLDPPPEPVTDFDDDEQTEPETAGEPSPEGPGAVTAPEGTDSTDEAIVSDLAHTSDVDIPSDVQALSEAAEHAFEASRGRAAEEDLDAGGDPAE